jgi:hypothetical protein
MTNEMYDRLKDRHFVTFIETSVRWKLIGISRAYNAPKGCCVVLTPDTLYIKIDQTWYVSDRPLSGIEIRRIKCAATDNSVIRVNRYSKGTYCVIPCSNVAGIILHPDGTFIPMTCYTADHIRLVSAHL